MNYVVHDQNEVVEVFLEGNDLQENVDFVKSRFNDLINNGSIKIVLNMEQSNYVSSLCLAFIVDIKKRLMEQHGDLKLTNVNRLIRNLLEITNLIKKFELFEDPEAAVTSFAKQS